MIKLFALALTLTAFALSSSFANCSGGCKGGKDGKPAPSATPAP